MQQLGHWGMGYRLVLVLLYRKNAGHWVKVVVVLSDGENNGVQQEQQCLHQAKI